MVESAREAAFGAMRGLRSFASVFKIKIGDVSIAVDPAAGVADSGSLEQDLTEMFVLIGEAAQSAGTGWVLLIDEVQYLGGQELPAIIIAVHRVNQLGLPVVFFGAGLPQLAALSGNAKSYAERLFNFPAIGPLDDDAARIAIRQPVEDEDESIDDIERATIFKVEAAWQELEFACAGMRRYCRLHRHKFCSSPSMNSRGALWRSRECRYFLKWMPSTHSLSVEPDRHH